MTDNVTNRPGCHPTGSDETHRSRPNRNDGVRQRTWTEPPVTLDGSIANAVGRNLAAMTAVRRIIDGDLDPTALESVHRLLVQVDRDLAAAELAVRGQ